MTLKALSFEQLLAQNKLSLQPYVLIGNDVYLKDVAKRHICKIIKNQQDTYSYNLLDGIKQEPWQQAVSQCQPNLFGQLNWCIAELPNGKPGKKGADYLIDVLKQQASFILCLPAIDKLTQQSAWYTAIKDYACVINLPNRDERFMKKYLSQLGQKLHLKLTDAIINWLITHVNHDLGAAAQALEKLSLTHQHQALQLILVQDYLLGNGYISIYDISEHLWAGHKQQTLDLLQQFNRQDTLNGLIWLLAEDIVMLIDFKQQLANQQQQSSINFASYRLWGKKLQSVQLALKRLSYQDLRKALHQLSLIEMQSKGAVLEDIKPQNQLAAMQDLMLRLMG